MKSMMTDKFEISNCSEDNGRNNELRRIHDNKAKEGVAEQDIPEHPFEYRPYQYEALDALFTKGYGRGLIEIPTAGGKSFIIANFIWNIWKNIDRHAKTLILVPNTQLVSQFYSDLVDYGFEKRDLAKFSGSLTKKEKAENDISSAKVIVANRQYLFKNKSLLPEVDALIADEVHTCTAS